MSKSFTVGIGLGQSCMFSGVQLTRIGIRVKVFFFIYSGHVLHIAATVNELACRQTKMSSNQTAALQ